MDVEIRQSDDGTGTYGVQQRACNLCPAARVSVNFSTRRFGFNASYPGNLTQEATMAPSNPEAARFPLHERARFPRGFRCMSSNIGLKKEGTDLALFASEVPG